MPRSADHDILCDAIRAGGELALRYFKTDVDQWHKEGHGPVTEADMAVDALLRERLTAARPDYGWLSEETVDNRDRLSKARVWIIDPIDGTRAFIKGRPHFTVVGALVEDGRPIAAAVFNPATGEFFEAEAGKGAFCDGAAISVSRQTSLKGCRMLGPAQMFAHPAWPERWPAMQIEQRNSVAYRVALVAKGEFDAMLALSWKSDWDLAAADLIVHEAGGRLTDHRGDMLVYNRQPPRHRSVVAAGPGLYDVIGARIRHLDLPQG